MRKRAGERHAVNGPAGQESNRGPAAHMPIWSAPYPLASGHPSSTILNWFQSYLQDRKYFVSIGGYESERTTMTCGVPQGSILGPLLFNIYILPLPQIIEQYNISYHTYVHDTQLYITVSPNDHSPLQQLNDCIEHIKEWMCHNFLQLNTNKTEIIIFGPKEERQTISTLFNSMILKPTNQARNLAVVLDSDLNFNIKAITKSAYYHLKNIARIK